MDSVHQDSNPFKQQASLEDSMDPVTPAKDNLKPSNAKPNIDPKLRRE